MTVDQLKIVFKTPMGVPIVRTRVTDEHCAVEMLNVMLATITQIAVVKLVSLAIPKSVVERLNVSPTKTVRMTNYVIKICAKLLV